MATLASIRNVAVIGHLHHGKTSLCDAIIEQSHTKSWKLDSPQRRYTDARRSEQERGMSIHTTAYSLVVGSLQDKSFLLHLLDCPGHPDFEADVEISVQACDAAIIAVDCIEGVRLGTRRAIQHAVRAGCRLILGITKLDRLILETHVPPEDAYAQLLTVVADTNAAIIAATAPGATPMSVDPRDGSVLFSSAQHGLLFSVESFIKQHCQLKLPVGSGSHQVSDARLSRRMWGDWRYNIKSRSFFSLRNRNASSTVAAASS